MSPTKCKEKKNLFLFLCLIVLELRLIMDACLLTLSILSPSNIYLLLLTCKEDLPCRSLSLKDAQI